MLSSPRRAKLAVVLAAGAVSFGGLAAAAYTGALPDGLQDLAHATVGAPAPNHAQAATEGHAVDKGETVDKHEGAKGESASGTKEAPVGPDATAQAAFGLCTAWEQVKAQGMVADKAIAFRNLTAAAGGVNNIAAYCATVTRPGSSPSGDSHSHPAAQTAHPPIAKSGSRPIAKTASPPVVKTKAAPIPTPIDKTISHVSARPEGSR